MQIFSPDPSISSWGCGAAWECAFPRAAQVRPRPLKAETGSWAGRRRDQPSPWCPVGAFWALPGACGLRSVCCLVQGVGRVNA